MIPYKAQDSIILVGTNNSKTIILVCDSVEKGFNLKYTISNPDCDADKQYNEFQIFSFHHDLLEAGLKINNHVEQGPYGEDCMLEINLLDRLFIIDQGYFWSKTYKYQDEKLRANGYLDVHFLVSGTDTLLYDFKFGIIGLISEEAGNWNLK